MTCACCDEAPCTCAMTHEIWGSCERRDYWLDIEDSNFDE